MNTDDDVLSAVKEMARRQTRPVGEVASTLLRGALGGNDKVPETAVRYGFRPFAGSNDIVSNDIINRLRHVADD